MSICEVDSLTYGPPATIGWLVTGSWRLADAGPDAQAGCVRDGVSAASLPPAGPNRVATCPKGMFGSNCPNFCRRMALVCGPHCPVGMRWATCHCTASGALLGVGYLLMSTPACRA